MLFTTLIPVYKTQFLEDSLQCLAAQSRQNFQVILSDDSPTQDLADVLEELSLTLRIPFPYRIIFGRRIGPASNCHDLLAAWNGATPLVHFLLDDDLIFPDFYLQHEAAYKHNPSIKMCVSARIIVHEKKTPLTYTQTPAFIREQNARFIPLHLHDCLRSTLPTCDNWLGELSCATFEGAALRSSVKNQLHQLPYYGLNDLGLFLEMLAAHPGCYIADHLGAFRVNRWQTSRDARSSVFQSTLGSWASLALDAYKLGHLDATHTLQCLHKLQADALRLQSKSPALAPLVAQLALLPDLNAFAASFEPFWSSKLQHIPDACTHITPNI